MEARAQVGSHKFAVSTGVSQGGIMSPWLFVMAMNDVTLRLGGAGGCVVNGQELGTLLYADDILLADDSIDSSESRCRLAKEWAEEWGGAIHPAKAQWLDINATSSPPPGVHGGTGQGGAIDFLGVILTPRESSPSTSHAGGAYVFQVEAGDQLVTVFEDAWIWNSSIRLWSVRGYRTLSIRRRVVRAAIGDELSCLDRNLMAAWLKYRVALNGGYTLSLRKGGGMWEHRWWVGETCPPESDMRRFLLAMVKLVEEHVPRNWKKLFILRNEPRSIEFDLNSERYENTLERRVDVIHAHSVRFQNGEDTTHQDVLQPKNLEIIILEKTERIEVHWNSST